MVKNARANAEEQGMWFPSLDQEDCLNEGMATHSSILAWKVPWTGEPGGLPLVPWGSKELDSE